MSDAHPEALSPPPKRSKLPVILGLVLMLGLGGGGFYAAYGGLIPGLARPEEGDGGKAPDDLPEIAFVPIERMVVSLGAEPGGRFLHFTGQIEIEKAQEAAMQLILPRVTDVLNGYLRAVEVSDLENPAALVRLRAQMLRRVQMISGEGRVRDLLVTEFVIN